MYEIFFLIVSFNILFIPSTIGGVIPDDQTAISTGANYTTMAVTTKEPSNDIQPNQNQTEPIANLDSINKTSAEVIETQNNTSQSNEEIVSTTEPVLELSTIGSQEASQNETFGKKISNVVRRLFKREIVGSLVIRGSDELKKEEKITVPMLFQAEYYALRKRKQEIERNKKIFGADPDKKKHADLIDHTFQLLVNWSIDHLAFEDKVIRVHKIKQHNNIVGLNEFKDSDCSPDSEQKIASFDSDDVSGKTLRPQMATVKNIMELSEKYPLEMNIRNLEQRIASDPREKNPETLAMLAKYKEELQKVNDKYEKILKMKLLREEIHAVHNDEYAKNMKIQHKNN